MCMGGLPIPIGIQIFVNLDSHTRQFTWIIIWLLAIVELRFVLLLLTNLIMTTVLSPLLRIDVLRRI